MPQYYCHRCLLSFDLDDSAEIACTRCHGEFIEIVNRPAMLAAMPPMVAVMNHLANAVLPGFSVGIAGEGQQQEQPAPQNQGDRPPTGAGGEAQNNGPSLQEFITDMFRMEPRGGEDVQSNMTFSFQMPGGVGIQIQAHRAGGGNNADGSQIPLFVGNIEGERADLENAMQEILATFQGDGGVIQRGFTESDIRDYLPMKKVTQQQVDNGAQCTTCFDIFKLDEDVGALDCNHIFHRPCIEPWLKNKNSCPVCRQKVNMRDWKKNYQKKTQEAVLEDLD